MLDPETGKSPLVYALLQNMPHAPNWSGGGQMPGQIPLGSLMQLMSFLKQPGATPAAQSAPETPLPTAGASAIG